MAINFEESVSGTTHAWLDTDGSFLRWVKISDDNGRTVHQYWDKTFGVWAAVDPAMLATRGSLVARG